MPEMTCNKEWRKKYGYVDLMPSEEGRKLPSGNWHFEHSSVLDQLKHFLTKLTYEIYLASHFLYIVMYTTPVRALWLLVANN